ncbi:hypothetical protein Tco_0868410 [Tanacetum coccineum]
MEFESAQSNTTAKLPIPTLGEYEMWVIRIKQYFQMSVPVTAEEKTNKKNDVKARSLLLVTLPNEHQLTFSQYIDAKTMFAAIKTRFGVWMNKANIETMSIDDLYKNIKIVEQDVKKSVGASSGAQNLAFITTPSTSSTNDVNTANPAYEVSIVSPNINTACPQDLKQIHEDDLEAIDLKWQLSLLRNVEHQGTKRSDMAEEQVQTNMALMAFLDSEGIEFKIEKFDKALKDLDKLLGSQITDKSKKGLGYNVVPSPHPLIYNQPKKLDLSYFGLDEFKDPEFKSYDSEEKQVSKDTSSFVESSLNVDKENVFLVDKKIEFSKFKNHEKPVKKSVRTHPNAQRNMVPRAVLMKTGLKPFNTARKVNTAHPKSIVFSAKPMLRFSKSAQ